MAITFNYEEVNFKLKKINLHKEWIKTIIIKEEKKVGDINYIFCTDEYLLDINKTYLNHDTYTDIITFDYTEGTNKISGDIYISVDRVEENAKEFAILFEEEMQRVLIHGILHLCGYPDKTKMQEKKMREKENESIAVFKQLESEKK